MSTESRVIAGELVPSHVDPDLPAQQGGLEVVGPSPLAAQGQSFDVRRFVHQAMRGKYILSIVLGLVVGGIFAALAWKMGRPLYYSEGIVRIAYQLPPVYENGENSRPMANFEQFMLSQRMVITSRAVVEQAMQNPVWGQRGMIPAGLDEYYADNLKVDIRPRSEFISVSVTDTDPAMAATAVTALVNAYAEYYKRQETDLERQRLGVLDTRHQALQTEIDDLSAKLRAAAQEYGTTS